MLVTGQEMPGLSRALILSPERLWCMHEAMKATFPPLALLGFRVEEEILHCPCR